MQFFGGTANTLNNYGRVQNLDGIGGTAILAGTGNETVNNFGVVTGIVNLGAGTNAFNNMAGGLFNSGATVDVGAGNTLTNHGTLSPGGAFSPAGFVTSLTGNFAQPGSALEVESSGRRGRPARRAGRRHHRAGRQGQAAVHAVGPGSFTQWTVLTTNSTVIQNNGIKAVDTGAVDFGLTFPTDMRMDLVLLGVDFAPDGLNKNERDRRQPEQDL